MYQRFKDRFGAAGVVIAVIALVAALGGSALAAQGALTGKQKKEVEKIAKKFQGTGPQGPAGPAGSAGPKGDKGGTGETGTAGADGADGTNGTSAKTKTFAGTKGACTEGGLEVESASPLALLCNGKKGEAGEDGDPWTMGGTLPSKATETGAWASSFTGEGFTPVSFAVPLSAGLAPTNAIIVPEGGSAPLDCENAEHTGTASVANPEADPGFLCVYVNLFAGGGTIDGIYRLSDLLQQGASVSGAMLYLKSAGADAAYGSWAVTAN